MKTCQSCLKVKIEEEFNRRGNGLQPTCRECNKQKSREYYQRNKKKHGQVVKKRKQEHQKNIQGLVFDYLLQHPCVDCQEPNPLVLDFDHLSNKERGISEMISAPLSWSRIEKEISKCEVRCKKCHSIKSHKESNSWRWKLFVQKFGSLA